MSNRVATVEAKIATCPTCGLKHSGVPADRQVRVHCRVEKGGCGDQFLHPATLPRLVLAVDATASRIKGWEALQQTTGALFEALPGLLEVALTVHSAGKVQAFTEFDSEHRFHREFMAGIGCVSGDSQIAAMMAQTLTYTGVKVFVYIGDHIEDEQEDLIDLAGRFAERGIIVLVLHDRTDDSGFGVKGCYKAAPIFNAMARITKGAVLPFDPSSLGRVREMLSAIAVFAAEGRKGLTAKRTKLKGADALLQLLPP